MQHRARSFIAAAKSPPDGAEAEGHMTNSIQLAEADENLPELLVSLQRYAELLDRKGNHTGLRTYTARDKALSQQIGYRI